MKDLYLEHTKNSYISTIINNIIKIQQQIRTATSSEVRLSIYPKISAKSTCRLPLSMGEDTRLLRHQGNAN